jgi:hypothetical protein
MMLSDALGLYRRLQAGQGQPCSNLIARLGLPCFSFNQIPLRPMGQLFSASARSRATSSDSRSGNDTIGLKWRRCMVLSTPLEERGSNWRYRHRCGPIAEQPTTRERARFRTTLGGLPDRVCPTLPGRLLAAFEHDRAQIQRRAVGANRPFAHSGRFCGHKSTK